ncbi:MAG: hypothetical protein HRT38_10045 [Alteromonadaceae bacterium]|nr:hypothetical protein [Alteromonadaceae bacterium]
MIKFPAFTITRLHTKQGIFRLKGMQDNDPPEKIAITKIEILGSDGWVLLDLNHDKIINLIADLHDGIIQHLTQTT